MEIAGTPPYMAPEVHCRKAYGRAMDWWSLGITLYKLMIGRVPFRGQNEVTLKVRITWLYLEDILKGFSCFFYETADGKIVCQRFGIMARNYSSLLQVNDSC